MLYGIPRRACEVGSSKVKAKDHIHDRWRQTHVVAPQGSEEGLRR